MCKTLEEIEGVLGRDVVAHSLYHLARLETRCNRHRDGVLNISADALYCAVWAELTHVQPQPQLKEANDSTRRLVAGAWLRIFRQASPGEYRDTGAVRRQMQKLARTGQPVPDWVARMCIYEWRLWHEQRAIEEFEGTSFHRRST
ncbi:hypothetical protein BOO71_0005185 [Deinococcus marmoris]|uniref:Uncharacterized protein n=1 Tax=Deinococcus marmoris TaxID=249408 RepID=A0A1U7P0L4_9DEIO|nr:hypothetical protein BOO71_0009286 [Deinococcus marmoris]OLV18715.1 hypothetical protein BOO71_0005185 [Deinococcus marmoris]